MNRTRSVAPLVLGIVGGVLGILEGSCLALCAKVASEVGVNASDWTIAGWMVLLGAIAGLVGGCCAKKTVWGSLVELVGGIVAVLSVIFVFDLLAFAAGVLLVIGGAVGMGKKAA